MTMTPRTDAAREATLTPEFEYEGAEHEAWAFARKLEIELEELKASIGHAAKKEYSIKL